MSNPYSPSRGQGNLANVVGVMGVTQAISFPIKKESTPQANNGKTPAKKDSVQSAEKQPVSLRQAYLQDRRPNPRKEPSHSPQDQQYHQPRSRGSREPERIAPSSGSDAKIQVVSSRLGSANIQSFDKAETKSLQDDLLVVEHFETKQDVSYRCDLSEESGVKSLSLFANRRQIYFAEFNVRSNSTEPFILKYDQIPVSIKNLADLPSDFVLSDDGQSSIYAIDQYTGIKIKKNQEGLFTYGFCLIRDGSFIGGCVVNENPQIQYNLTTTESPTTTSSQATSTSKQTTSPALATSASLVHHYSCNSTQNGFEIFDSENHDVVNFSLTPGSANATFYESKLSFNDRKEFTLIGLGNSYNFNRFGNTTSQGVTLLNSSAYAKTYQMVVANKTYKLVFDLKGSEVENATIIDQNGVGIKFKVDANSRLSSEAIIDQKSVTNCSAFQVSSSPIPYYQNCSTVLNSSNGGSAQSIEIKSSSASKYEANYTVNKRLDQNQNLSISVDFNGIYQGLSINPRLTMQDNFNLISKSFNQSGSSSGLNVKFENNSIIFSDKSKNELNPFGIKLRLTKKENGLFAFQYLNGDKSCPSLSESDDVLKNFTTSVAFNSSATAPLTTKFITSSARPTTSSTSQATSSSARPTTSSTSQASSSSARPTTSSTSQATTSSSEVFTTSTPYQISSASIIIPTNTSGLFCDIKNGTITLFNNSGLSGDPELTVKLVPDPSRMSYIKSCKISSGSDNLVFSDNNFTFNGDVVDQFPKELMIGGKKYNITKVIERDQTRYAITQGNLELSVQYHENGEITFETKNQGNLISQCNYDEQGIVTSSSSSSGAGISIYSTPETTTTVEVSPDGTTAEISTTTSPTSPTESLVINIPKFLNGFGDYCRDYLKGANSSGYDLGYHLATIIDKGIEDKNIILSKSRNDSDTYTNDTYEVTSEHADKLTSYLKKIVEIEEDGAEKQVIKKLITELEKCPRDSKIDIGGIVGTVIGLMVLFLGTGYCLNKISRIDRRNNLDGGSPGSSAYSDSVYVTGDGSPSRGGGVTRDYARSPSSSPSVRSGVFSRSSSPTLNGPSFLYTS